jgi:hypothetical protein
MLLRELLKVSTSSRYHKRLNAIAPGAIGDAATPSESQDIEAAGDEVLPPKKAKLDEE